MRRRTIRKIAGVWAIKLDVSDARDFGLVEGDIVDIDRLDFLIEINDKKEKKKKNDN